MQPNQFVDVLARTDDITGTHSYYHNWYGHEIMYHVANCIPYNPNDPQQLERKRQVRRLH